MAEDVSATDCYCLRQRDVAGEFGGLSSDRGLRRRSGACPGSAGSLPPMHRNDSDRYSSRMSNRLVAGHNSYLTVARALTAPHPTAPQTSSTSAMCQCARIPAPPTPHRVQCQVVAAEAATHLERHVKQVGWRAVAAMPVGPSAPPADAQAVMNSVERERMARGTPTMPTNAISAPTMP